MTTDKQTQTLTFWSTEDKHTREPDDPRIERLWMLAKNIAKHLALDNHAKDEADFFADRLLDKLESSLMYYQLIKADDFDARDISQKRTIYEGLYANLWSFYKGRVQNFLQSIGWSIPMLFCRQHNFESEAKKFIEDNPGHEALVELARSQRQAWQDEFAKSRNFSEHSGDYRGGIETYESKTDAQRLFAQVCWLAETLVAYCGSYKMGEDWNVVEKDPSLNIFQDNNRYVIESAYLTNKRPSGD